MVQIGNFHIGKPTTAQDPKLSVLEAGLLWEYLVSRYDAIEYTQIIQNFIHDVDLNFIVKKGLADTLEKEANQIEKIMNDFKIPLPARPEKSINTLSASPVLTDRFIFRQTYTQIQTFFNMHVRAISSAVYNDQLRAMFIKFLKAELDVFDDLCKYGKAKGWLHPVPIYKPQ